MKKNIIIAVVLVLAVLGVAIIIKFSQGSTPTTGTTQGTVEDSTNPAAKLEEGEVKITQDNFAAEVTNYKGVVMVDMFLPNCPHCQVMGPVVSEIAKENKDKYKIGKADMNANPELGTEYKIESVPAFIFFKDGKEVSRLIGEQTKEALLAKLQEAAK